MSAGGVYALLLSSALVPASPGRALPEMIPTSSVAATFVPTSALDFAALKAVVRRRSEVVRDASRSAAVATAEVEQSELFGNPVLDATWGTMPLGSTNPPDLKDPWAHVPNYTVGLSYTFPLGKRGPNQRRALASLEAARADLESSLRHATLELAAVLGKEAVLMLRLDGLRQLTEGAVSQLELTERRVEASFAKALDVDRLRIDLERAKQQVASVESDLSEAGAECASLLGQTCSTFASSADARAFLDRWVQDLPAPSDVRGRSDLRALEARSRAAEGARALAEAQAIPDPTVRLAYTHDTFTVSGNQADSLGLTVSLPLPVFDHGQAAVSAAEAEVRGLAEIRERRIEVAETRVKVLQRRLDAQRARQQRLREVIIPDAVRVYDGVRAAADERLISVDDLIQSRRVLAELLLEESDSSGDAYAAALELRAEIATEEPESEN